VSSEVLTQAVGPAAPAAFGQGRIFNLLSAPGGPVTITCDRRSIKGGQTQPRVFKNVPAGTKFIGAPGDEWTYLRLTSASVQQITIFIGDEDLQFNNAVTVTGTASVSINPSATITATVAPTVVATGTASTVAANPARRRVTITAAALNTGNLYVQSVGAAIANGGIPVSPGTFEEFDTLSAFDVRNDTGGNQSYSAFEES
jgi:hypothetical protein